MKKTILLVSSLCFLIAATGCNRDKATREARERQAQSDVETAERETPDTLAPGGYDHEKMDAAIARAKAEVDNFIDILGKRQGSDFSVKVPITDGGETEHFWVIDVTYVNGVFQGKIGNEPGVVTNVRFGQKWKVAKAEISDWSFMRDGKIHGNYTLRPLLETLPKEEADYYRAKLAHP